MMFFSFIFTVVPLSSLWMCFPLPLTQAASHMLVSLLSDENNGIVFEHIRVI
ncbi:rCG53391 [Rattus norvegicus]|uniref:RCG53391 n=1 Tax=Rattus norvegicus TaxID=10116 RepID=A6JRI1_RAT|nr:rCG53391 [Rattus norvegicus]